MQHLGGLIGNEQANTNNLFLQTDSRFLKCMLLNYKVCLVCFLSFIAFLTFCYLVLVHLSSVYEDLQMNNLSNMTTQVKQLTDRIKITFTNASRSN